MAKAAQQPRVTKRSRGGAIPYHHGSLDEALLIAAERVLIRDGLAGLTLRAVAREAGVSHAAPRHHFGDLAGLVSELAAMSFRRLNARIAAAGTTGKTPTERRLAQVRAHIAYAQDQPAMYGLMFRIERLDMSRPSLQEAVNASFAGLADECVPGHPEKRPLSFDHAAAVAAAWSLAHGFSVLLLDGRLGKIIAQSQKGVTTEALLEAMLRKSVTQ
ncbi:TetR/AcrR family transcriptional regulator [Bradyrhizobium sp. CCBAU 53338]|uniref:TetR/AcrR family transcriptional regulator n=1 Tax=Bradyrhizobium sp. CCBAU 53338 TaxID=1325111 RepID=UPI00188B68DB|nr:TetR/AcrR family transcriptional regulator [Bradyrhizobium sp. CCBAU 53338]QOZ51510.1 TetR/AcrR family transcriptional regulator [Bradyrhizobium sp. CCBAU 53338]